MKTFSVIIPTLNEQQYISGILTDIKKQTTQPTEIIVVDGFSKDKTQKIISQKFQYVKLYSTPPNISSQRNYGAKNATANYLIFLDADTRLPNNQFFNQLQSRMNKNNKIFCPFYLPYKSNPIIFVIYLFFNTMFFVFQKIVASGAGSCVIIEKKLFLKLGGFNQDTRFEDIELIRKASKITNFKMTPQFIWVSDRRFKKYGIIRTTIQYLVLSFLFLFNQFNHDAGFSYQFGKYNKK
jgi:glycosyltransferase involved in cell wall biosynthesis